MADILLITLIMIGVALVGLTLVAAFFAWRVLRSDERKLAKRIGKLPIRDKLRLGGALFTDPRVPMWSRFIAIGLVLYLASPIDLIPDFIPGLGLLDDLLIVMIGAGLLLRSVPRYVIEEHLAEYEPRSSSKRLPPPAATASR